VLGSGSKLSEAVAHGRAAPDCGVAPSRSATQQAARTISDATRTLFMEPRYIITAAQPMPAPRILIP
jgi:hypothetical protein